MSEMSLPRIADESAAHSSGSRLAPWLGEARAVVVLGGPLILTQLAQMAMPTTDMVLIGYLGQSPLAAASLAHSLHIFVWLFGLGPASAIAPIIAQVLGAHPRDRARVRASVRMGLWSTFLLTPLLCAPLLYAEAILLLLGQSPELAALAAPYAQILAVSIPFSLAFNVLRNFATALSRPRTPLIVVGVAVLLNFLLCYGLIFGRLGLPELGLIGAAVATTASNIFMFVAMVAIIGLAPSLRCYRIWRRFHRADVSKFRETFRLGFGIGVTMIFEVALFVGATFLVGRFGTAAVAAHQIALNIASVTFMVPLGLAIASTVRVGLAAGAGDLPGVRRAGFTALMLGVTFMIGCAALFTLLPREIVSLYLDVNDPSNMAAVELAVTFLYVAAAFAIFDGTQVLMNMSLRGLKDVHVPMWIAGFSYWLVGLPLAVFFGFALGLEGLGVWLGLAASLLVAAGLMLSRFAYLSGAFASAKSVN